MDTEAQLKRLESENSRLRRAVEELSILNDVATAMSLLGRATVLFM